MTNNYCQLTYEERQNIEDLLNNGKKITYISKKLNRSHSTIIREIERNKIYSKPSSWNNYHARCKNFSICNRLDKYMCDEKKECFVRNTCDRLNKSPHVCNGCKSRSGCRKERFTYYAKDANNLYKESISDCKKGVDLTQEDVFNINNLITPLIMKGQTVNHVYINHPDILNFSKTSFYNYVSLGLFEFKPSNLPRMVKYKKRNKIKRRSRKEREILNGRTYSDFVNFIFNNPDAEITEMDTVEGLKSDSKCLLTIFFRKSNFMLIFLLESQTSDEVTKVFDYLQKTLPQNVYKKLFQVILTDNGHEFFDVINIECNHTTGERITNVFYCDPSASYQKGGIEKNHEFIRYVLPKKTSFKDLTQDDCNILMNNINSLCRESLNNNCPYKAMLFMCDEDILHLLNCFYIEPDQVQLNKKLLKK